MVSRLFVHPVARNWILRHQQLEALQSLPNAVETWQCNLIVLSNRMYLFAIEELQKRARPLWLIGATALPWLGGVRRG